jgi:UDP-galactopyranose mutase
MTRCQKALIPQLESVGALRQSQVEFIDWKLVRETYPIYDKNYRKKLSNLTLPKNLTLLGRCGSFWYNNMDHSISQALAFSKGERFERDFWSR